MTDKSCSAETFLEIGELYETLRVRLPRSTIAEMDAEIAADPRYHGSRSEFVFCAVEYALYCIPFEKGLEWLEEQSEAVNGQADLASDVSGCGEIDRISSRKICLKKRTAHDMFAAHAQTRFQRTH